MRLALSAFREGGMCRSFPHSVQPTDEALQGPGTATKAMDKIEVAACAVWRELYNLEGLTKEVVHPKWALLTFPGMQNVSLHRLCLL